MERFYFTCGDFLYRQCREGDEFLISRSVPDSYIKVINAVSDQLDFDAGDDYSEAPAVELSTRVFVVESQEGEQVGHVKINMHDGTIESWTVPGKANPDEAIDFAADCMIYMRNLGIQSAANAHVRQQIVEGEVVEARVVTLDESAIQGDLKVYVSGFEQITPIYGEEE